MAVLQYPPFNMCMKTGTRKTRSKFIGGEGEQIFEMPHTSLWVVHINKDVGVL
jgi:hypothetical protein